MSNRRKFLQNTILGATAVSTGLIGCNPSGGDASTTDQKTNSNSQKGFPVVIATWNPNVKATEAAWQKLESGGTALDAVEAGARVPEADPTDTSVGYGGLPDRDGIVTLDACIMDEKGNAGSVTFLQNIMHPISVARLVMEKTSHVMLSGEGALQFALENGFKEENLLTDNAKKAWEEWLKTSNYQPKINVNNHDTIGILAIDKTGNISGACTTSGAAYKMHGRVGDSPILGAGMYVDNEVGGACATGQGEFMMKTVGSFLIVELMRQGRTPQEACEEAIHRIHKRYGATLPKGTQVGYLAINKAGEHGAYSLLEGFHYALYQGDQNRALDASYLEK
jgi:N4-(beta-N-acetylglucosaminyl)-L-asparaginase